MRSKILVIITVLWLYYKLRRLVLLLKSAYPLNLWNIRRLHSSPSLNNDWFVRAITYLSQQLHICQNFCPNTLNFLSWALSLIFCVALNSATKPNIYLLPQMGLIHYSFARTILINSPCALGSLPCNLLFANGAGGVQNYFHHGFQPILASLPPDSKVNSFWYIVK